MTGASFPPFGDIWWHRVDAPDNQEFTESEMELIVRIVRHSALISRMNEDGMPRDLVGAFLGTRVVKTTEAGERYIKLMSLAIGDPKQMVL